MSVAMETIQALATKSAFLNPGTGNAYKDPRFVRQYNASRESRSACMLRTIQALSMTYHQELMPLSVQTKTKNHPERFEGRNHIVRHYRSEQPSIILSAHLDHFGGLGVVDNASGLGIITEILYRLRTIKHDVWALFFDLEEYGLCGSEAFVYQYDIGRKYEHDGPVVINVDGVGSGELVSLCPTPPGTCRDGYKRQHHLQGLPHLLRTRDATDANMFAALGCPVTTLTSYSSRNGNNLSLETMNNVQRGTPEDFLSSPCNTIEDTLSAVSQQLVNRATNILFNEVMKIPAVSSRH